MISEGAWNLYKLNPITIFAPQSFAPWSFAPQSFAPQVYCPPGILPPMEHLNLIKNYILNINISDQMRVVNVRLIMYGTVVARAPGFK